MVSQLEKSPLHISRHKHGRCCSWTWYYARLHAVEKNKLCLCIYIILVHEYFTALFIFLACLRVRHALQECVQLQWSPYILINAVRVNFTHGSKRRLF